jgi:hypothetical protein
MKKIAAVSGLWYAGRQHFFFLPAITLIKPTTASIP